MQDTDLIQFGKHKGKMLKDVDRNYWIYLHDRGKLKGKLLEWAKKAHPILNYGKKVN